MTSSSFFRSNALRARKFASVRAMSRQVLTLWLPALLLACSSSVTTSGGGGDTLGGGGGGFGGAGGALGPATTGGGGAGGINAVGGSGGDGGGSTACADSCASSGVNASPECGACLLSAVGTQCGTAYTTCGADVANPNDGCVHCGELLSCSGDNCPNAAELCQPSRALFDALNGCLCGVCGGADAPTPEPGFISCDHPTLPPSICNDLDKSQCLQMAGCRAIYSDPCIGAADCAPYANFRHCTAVQGVAAAGSCGSLRALGCASREDCVTVNAKDFTNCCPAPTFATPFIECRDEPQAPITPPSCGNKTQGQCLADEDCRPAYSVLNGFISCGPYLTELSECLSCWPSVEYKLCTSSW